jgi:acyl-CoA synthetase (AMP-forming)/AMP-acid ligase II
VIEEAIYEHPSVEEVCVIGIPTPTAASRRRLS